MKRPRLIRYGRLTPAGAGWPAPLAGLKEKVLLQQRLAVAGRRQCLTLRVFWTFFFPWWARRRLLLLLL
jgi:hypothetical protein